MSDFSPPSQADVEAFVEAALAALPPPFAARLATANLVVLVADWPTPVQRQAVHLGPGGDLYGLYEGIPLPARNQGYNLVSPDVVTIFAGALLRDFPNRAALEQQVRRTVLHELAHHWGISDGRLTELGAY